MPFSSKEKYNVLKEQKKVVQFQYHQEHIQKNQIQISKIAHTDHLKVQHLVQAVQASHHQQD